MFPSFIKYLCFVYITIIVNLNIWIHCRNQVSISEQYRLNYRQLESPLFLDKGLSSFIQLPLHIQVLLYTPTEFLTRILYSLQLINPNIKSIHIFVFKFLHLSNHRLIILCCHNFLFLFNFDLWLHIWCTFSGL